MTKDLPAHKVLKALPARPGTGEIVTASSTTFVLLSILDETVVASAIVGEGGTYVLNGVTEIDTLISVPSNAFVTCGFRQNGALIGEEITVSVENLHDEAIPLSASATLSADDVLTVECDATIADLARAVATYWALQTSAAS